MDDTDKAHTNLPSTHFRIQEEKIFIVIIMMLTKFDVCERRWKKVRISDVNDVEMVRYILESIITFQSTKATFERVD